MDIQIFVKNAIKDLDEERWARLSAGRPFASRRWLEYCERVFEDDRPVYLIAVNQGEWIGAAVFWLRKRPSLPDVSQLVETVLGGIFRLHPLLICEIPIVGRPGLILPEDAEVQMPVLDALREEATMFAAHQHAALVVFGYLDDATNSPRLWPASFRTVQLFPGTGMELSGLHSYRDYLASLTKKQRKNIRRNREAALAEGVSVLRQRSIDADLAVRLAKNVAGKHGGTLQREIRRIFAHAGMVDSVWLTAIVNGEIVGFDLLLGDRGTWKVQSTGSDYSTDRLYFLLSDEDIRFAIEQSADRLIAGTHLYTVKERLGYTVQRDGHVRYTGTTLLGRLLRTAAGLRQKPPQS